MISQLCKLIAKNNDNEKDFELFLTDLLESIKQKLNEYSQEQNFDRFVKIQNYIQFFMLMVLNIKNNKTLVKIIFNGKLNFIYNLIDNINNLKSKKKNQLFNFLNQLFLEEYKDIFFDSNDISLQELFIELQGKLSEINSSNITFYDEKTYLKMFEKLLSVDINYNNFFANNKNIDLEQKPIYKSIIIQSLIRIIFSKSKDIFYKEKEKYYEFNFIKNVIDKDIKETKEKFGDDYRVLFKKEDIFDDIIKYLFFVFGNSMYLDSFVIPLKTLLITIGITDELIKSKNIQATKRDITKEEFNNLFQKILDNLSKEIPDILKMVLKSIYESTLTNFTLDKNNYSPLYKCLFFNFLISPRIQMLYSINPLECLFVKSLNRILRNICFNIKFNESDPLNSFNDIIQSKHEKLQNFMNDNIISFQINDDIKNSLKDFLTEKYLIIPKFLFYYDSQFTCNLFEGGVDQIISFGEFAH